MAKRKAKRIEKGYQRRLDTFHESTAAEIQAGLKRHKPGSRNPRKIGR